MKFDFYPLEDYTQMLMERWRDRWWDEDRCEKRLNEFKERETIFLRKYSNMPNEKEVLQECSS